MCVFITKREKAESEAQRGKPKGTSREENFSRVALTLESEIRSTISLLGQHPPRYTGVGM